MYAPELIGKRLEATRMAVGCESLKSFHDYIDTDASYTAIRNYHNGDRPATVEYLCDVASSCGVSVGWLARGTNASEESLAEASVEAAATAAADAVRREFS